MTDNHDTRFDWHSASPFSIACPVDGTIDVYPDGALLVRPEGASTLVGRIEAGEARKMARVILGDAECVSKSTFALVGALADRQAGERDLAIAERDAAVAALEAERERWATAKEQFENRLSAQANEIEDEREAHAVTRGLHRDTRDSYGTSAGHWRDIAKGLESNLDLKVQQVLRLEAELADMTRQRDVFQESRGKIARSSNELTDKLRAELAEARAAHGRFTGDVSALLGSGTQHEPTLLKELSETLGRYGALGQLYERALERVRVLEGELAKREQATITAARYVQNQVMRGIGGEFYFVPKAKVLANGMVLAIGKKYDVTESVEALLKEARAAARKGTGA